MAAERTGAAARSVVLDTGVLLALWDPCDERHHAARAAVGELLTGGCRLVVPASVLSETLVGAFRATPYAVRTVEQFVDTLVREVPAADRVIGRLAARLRAEHRWLPLGDALVVATGECGGAGQILTTNGRLAGLAGRVRVLG